MALEKKGPAASADARPGKPDEATPDSTQLATVLQHVDAYCRFGWRLVLVYPPKPDGTCSCPRGGDCDTKSIAKHPIGNAWQKNATADAGQFKQRFHEAYRRLGLVPSIGVATGRGSNLVVIDVDDQKAHEAMEEQFGELPRTVTSKTGSGGSQLFFWASDQEINSRAHIDGGKERSVDVRGNGGQVVLPPSHHKNGGGYEWIIAPWDEPLAALPKAWIDFLADGSKTTPALTPTSTPSADSNGDMTTALECLKKLRPVRADDYDSWVRVGMILHAVSGGDPAALAAWDRWSCQSAKHKPGECAEKWQGFNGQKEKSVGLGTLITWTREDSDRARPAPLPWKPFPVDALPTTLRSFVMSLSRATATDPSMSALSILVVCAGCIGNRVAALVRGGWIEPAVLWGALVVRSGALKSPVFRNAKRPLVEIYKAERLAFAEKLREYEANKIRYAAERSEWMAERKKGGSSDPPLEPDSPTERRAFVSDITVEKLACVLQENPLGLIVLRDELSALIGGFDRYAAGGKGSDRANYLSMYDANDIVVDRKSQAGTIFVERAAVSILGTIQPVILRRLFGVDERESGLLARLLLVSPPDRPALWTESGLSEQDIAEWKAVLHGLLDIPAKPDDGGVRPQFLPIGRDAKPLWIDWHDAHERERVKVEDDDLAAHYAKLKGACVRIALIVECVEAVSSGRPATFIGPDAMRRAIQISEWFKHEARRVYAMLSETDEERKRRKLIDLIRQKGGCVSVREWQRIRSHKSAFDAEAELNTLIPAGEWRPVPSGPKGGRETTIFHLTDSLTLTQPQITTQNEGCVSVRSVRACESMISDPDDDNGDQLVNLPQDDLDLRVIEHSRGMSDGA